MRRRNPYIGKHPDLFGGETRVFRPLKDIHPEDLNAANLSDLDGFKREDFGEDEWLELDEDVQEYIYERDEESQARIKNLVDDFVGRYKWAAEPNENYAIESVGDYFGQWLNEEDENLISHAGDDGEEVIEEFTDRGYSREDVEGALTQALKDESNYNFSLGDEYGSAFFKDRAYTGGFYIDRGDLDKLLEGMFEDEIERALVEINHETYLHFDRADLDKRYGIEKEVESDTYVNANPNWRRIRTELQEALADVEKEGEGEKKAGKALPYEDRIVHRFKDGAYIVDLLPGELKEEGDTQGICVGQPQYGYAQAVRHGKTKIFSLRTSSGRPKFTIEADLKRDGSIGSVRQVKGKSNRLPGWDLHREGSGPNVKVEEVLKIVEFIKSLGLDPEAVSDLAPALRAMKALPPVKKNPHTRRVHCGWCNRPI